MEYSTEPEEIFLPLSAQRYCEFYDIEMTDFNADLGFYLSGLSEKMNILELGCGSGRLTRTLAARGHKMTGVDISSEMLTRAALQDAKNITYVREDMAKISFQRRFDAIIIPYNTLNLLVEPGKVERCLQCCRDHLPKNGLLFLQLFLPDSRSMATGNAKTFQFQIFKTPGGGKIIKETLKNYKKEEQCIVLQERYRVRPVNGTKEDLAHTFYLSFRPYEAWLRMIAKAGFTINAEYGDYTLSPFAAGKSSCLLLIARAR